MATSEAPRTNPYLRPKCETCGSLADPDNGMKIKHRVVDEQPDEDELMGWVLDQEHPRATDGCEPIEPDGWCEHGHQSWMLRLGLI
jgi:hypothetical protein